MSRETMAIRNADIRRNGWWPGQADALPERAARARQERIDLLKAAGWRAKEFRPPKSRKRPMTGMKRVFNTWIFSDTTGVWDHAYRLVHKSGRVLYVGEPYQLAPGREMEGVEQLIAAGWRVTIRAKWALHYPGATVAVHVEEPTLTSEWP